MPDRLTQLIELACMTKPPKEEARYVMKLYPDHALRVAEKCISTVEGMGNKAVTDYWKEVYGHIKLHYTHH